MFEVAVEETFAAGHALRGYKGKCENVHGHNYKVRVVLAGEKLDETGLVYDFVELKQRIGEVVQPDHRFLNDSALHRDQPFGGKHQVFHDVSRRLAAAPTGCACASDRFRD
jgi:queuosine biosynthesis protein QueD